MIDINAFIRKYNGKYVEDGDSSNPYECADLASRWRRDNKWPEWPPSVMNMTDFYKKGDGRNYKWIKNTPNGVPRVGDFIVFANGHIAIVTSANVWKVSVFQQNAPRQTTHNRNGVISRLGSPCNLATYNYLLPRCLGWLHKL